MAPALRHLYDAANPTRRKYDGFMDVISARAAIGRNIEKRWTRESFFQGFICVVFGKEEAWVV